MLPILALLSLAPALAGGDDDFEFDLEGYWRTRAYVFKHLYEGQKGDGFQFGNLFDGEEGDGRLMVTRLRLQPQLNFQDQAKFFAMADVLDEVVWGDNQSLASTSLFAGDPSTTGWAGRQDSTFKVRRAWTEFKLPVGLMRVGRMPSEWGMGLLANGGDGFDDAFGENHYGSTYDRVIVATRPIAIAQKAMGKTDSEIPLFVAIGVDRLVEDPLYQYYGYPCTEDAPVGDGSDDPRCDEDGDGYSDATHSEVDDEYTEDKRANKEDWWVDQDDDVMEMIYVVVYRGNDVPIFGTPGVLNGGVYIVSRVQRETKSDVLISDGWVKFHWKGIYAESEVLNIRGNTDAIALPGAYDPYGDLANPLHKEADIWGYVARAGYKVEKYAGIFETGYASGDENVADVDFTGRPLHPDFNVGLLLYEEILARVTAELWPGAEGLWSKGGVYNSRYVYPQVSYTLKPGWEVVGAWLMAWPDRPDGSRILCREGDERGGEAIECAEYKAKDAALGWEADLAVKGRFDKHMLFSLETGYAKVTDRLPLDKPGLNPEGKFWTVQSRLAYEF